MNSTTVFIIAGIAILLVSFTVYLLNSAKTEEEIWPELTKPKLKKKRGRPKGSKNKPVLKKKKGRPVGSKNKAKNV